MSRTARSTIAALAALAMTLAATGAFGELSAADKETARSLMKEGREHRASGDHKAALERFRAADAIMHVPTTRFEVGKSQADLGLLLEARDTLLELARTLPQAGEPPPFATARADAQVLADQLAPRIPSVHITLKAGTPTTKLAVDGVELAGGALGVPRKMNPGAHTITASTGNAKKTMSVVIAEGETKEVTLDLSEATTTSEPIDKPIDKPIDRPIDKPSVEVSRGINPLVYIGFGVAGAGLVVGSTTGLLHLSKTSSLKDQCPNDRCPPSLADDYSSARTLATVSTVSFVVAGLGAAVGVYGLLAPPKPEGGANVARKPGVTPWLGFGMAGFTVVY